MSRLLAAPLDSLWQPGPLIRVLVAGQALSLVLALAPGLDGDWLVYFGLTSLLVQWIVLLVVGALYLLRRPLARVPAQRIAWLTLVLLMLSTWLVGGLAWSVLRSMGLSLGDWWRFIAQVSAIALTMGLAGLAVFQNHWRSRQLAIRAKQSELDALRARIHPHFLFNTLNTATALVRGRPHDAEQVLMDLADLFRAALSGRQEALLAEEIALVRQQLQIEALRFGQRLRVEWALPDPLPSMMLPTLSIQPLVENAIRYGVEPAPEGGWIRIGVEQIGADPARLEITVRNSLPAVARNGPGHGVGLKAVAARIEEFSGGGGSVRTAEDADGFVAVVSLPMTPADTDLL